MGLYKLYVCCREGFELPAYQQRHPSFWLRLLNSHLTRRLYVRLAPKVVDKNVLAVLDYPHQYSVYDLKHVCERVSKEYYMIDFVLQWHEEEPVEQPSRPKSGLKRLRSI